MNNSNNDQRAFNKFYYKYLRFAVIKEIKKQEILKEEKRAFDYAEIIGSVITFTAVFILGYAACHLGLK